MTFQLAQLNVARFIRPREDEANLGFINNLDRVNAEAEAQPGFVWRLVGDGNDATDIQAGDDEQMIINVSLWESVEALSRFVYRNKMHREIMRKREQWFGHLEVHLVLWWVQTGHQPSVEEALEKLSQLEENGPTAEAFNFKNQFPAPIG